MNTKDKQDFNKARNRIFSLMKDEMWHTASRIIKTSGQREGLRRLRELRKRDDVLEIKVARLKAFSREYKYRMILRS